MTSSKRLALLLCGILPSPLLEKYGDYGKIYREWLLQTMPEGTSFTLDPYDVVEMKYPEEDQIDSYDGIIYTGSRASAYEDAEWIIKLTEFTARIAREKPQIKLIGICFGHQIVGRAFGSQCVQNSGWELGPTPIELTKIGREVFNVDTFNIQHMHRDHVLTVPPEFHLLGSTPFSNNQGMVKYDEDSKPGSFRLDNIHILTLQGHPEFYEGIVSGLVEIRSKDGVITPQEAADAMHRKDWNHDGYGVLAKAIWGVLGATT